MEFIRLTPIILLFFLNFYSSSQSIGTCNDGRVCKLKNLEFEKDIWCCPNDEVCGGSYGDCEEKIGWAMSTYFVCFTASAVLLCLCCKFVMFCLRSQTEYPENSLAQSSYQPISTVNHNIRVNVFPAPPPSYEEAMINNV